MAEEHENIMSRTDRLNYMEISEPDSQCLQEIWTELKPALPDIMDEFYTHIGKFRNYQN